VKDGMHGRLRIASLVVIVASACKPEPPETAGPSAPAEPAPAIACPERTTLRGAAPPDGHRVWCETSAGVSHGPFRSWYAGGERKTEGIFRNGQAHGEWASWYDDGQLRSRGRYDDGAPVGQWERFNRDGTPAPAVVEAEPQAEPPPSGPPVVIGIEICDLWIERYGACVEAKAPEAVKPAIRDAMQKTVEVWKEAANGPARDALEQGCRAAYDAVKKAAEGWGCEL
jgi:hypothetical protein